MVKITELFDENKLTQKNDGNYQTECPCCGLQGGRTEGFILFTETNTAYCHSSHKNFNLLETYALQKGIIGCLDGRDTGEKKYPLTGDLLKQTLDSFREEHGDDLYNQMLEQMNIKESIELPNDGTLISTFARKLARKIKTENIFFYRPDTTQIVEIGKIKHPNGDIEYTGFVPVESNRFITIIERYFKPWQRIYTKQGEKIVTKSMPSSVAKVVMVADEFRDAMPIINRIFTIPIPIMYKGELTFPKKGYDERFGSWLPFNAPEIENPNMSIEDAKQIIQYIYSEFCYQSKTDFTHAVAGLITPFLRGLYKRFTCRTPLFVITANRERAGKDYHEGVRSIVYEGITLEEPPISNSDNAKSNQNDELRKKILANMMYGRKKIHFSNNKGMINNAVFESILTAENFADRKLGSNTMLQFPHEIEYSMSGNVGIGMTADLANRSRKIVLFLDIEDANARSFKNPDLHGWVAHNRSLILSALYAFVRNWVEKGMPDGTHPFASYPEWARVCGGIMESAGYDSPCLPDKESLGIACDSETSDMKQLFELCYEKYPEIPITKQEMKDIIQSEGDGLFSYLDWDKKRDQTRFGMKIGKYVGRIMSDIKMNVENPDVRSSRMKYIFTKQKQNFDKKSVFGADFDEKVVTLGNLGNLYNPVETPPKGDCSRGSNVTNVTIGCQTENPAKNDRQVQFWDAPECSEIKPNHDKQQVLDWIKNNPAKSFKELYDALGVGSLKHLDELKESGEVSEIGEVLVYNGK